MGSHLRLACALPCSSLDHIRAKLSMCIAVIFLQVIAYVHTDRLRQILGDRVSSVTIVFLSANNLTFSTPKWKIMFHSQRSATTQQSIIEATLPNPQWLSVLSSLLKSRILMISFELVLLWLALTPLDRSEWNQKQIVDVFNRTMGHPQLSVLTSGQI